MRRVILKKSGSQAKPQKR